MYIKNRLKRASLFRKKNISFNKPKVIIGFSSLYENVAKEIFPYLNQACAELENMHSPLYTYIMRQLHCTERIDEIAEIMVAIGHEIFRKEPNWGKIIAVFCVAGGLAVEAVKMGTPEKVCRVSDGIAELLEDKIAGWVMTNGGWVSKGFPRNFP